MGIRKNAKFLSPTEKENFVRACVLLKADIVNSSSRRSAVQQMGRIRCDTPDDPKRVCARRSRREFRSRREWGFQFFSVGTAISFSGLSSISKQGSWSDDAVLGLDRSRSDNDGHVSRTQRRRRQRRSTGILRGRSTRPGS